MADTYYAWSDLHSTKDGKLVVVKTGEKVTAADLGLNKDEFDELIAAGSVRDAVYPAKAMTDEGFAGSPKEFAKKQLAALAAEDAGPVNPDEMASLASDLNTGTPEEK